MSKYIEPGYLLDRLIYDEMKGKFLQRPSSPTKILRASPSPAKTDEIKVEK